MLQSFLPFQKLRRSKKLSERALALSASLSRGAVRDLLSPSGRNVTVNSVNQLAEHFGRDVAIIVTPPTILSEYSTIAGALKVERDGFDSWKIHLFDFVDEFRRTVDARLLLLPPPSSSDERLQALFASVVVSLCEEVEVDSPTWAKKRYFLPEPWFVSGMQSLKATALLESPLPFRRNNIFVLENFLTRA